MTNYAVDTDIDIDFADRDLALRGLMHVAASTLPAEGEQTDKYKRHPSGVYFQDVPVDPITGYCSLTYKEAADKGYFKVDFLNNSIYADVRDDDHLNELVSTPPDWGMLEHKELVALLAHIGSHFGIVQVIKPKSIEDLAVVLALIRPGKRHLLYKPRAEIDAEIWSSSADDSYSFKKAHAIAYAVTITVQMNLIYEKIAKDLENDHEDRWE